MVRSLVGQLGSLVLATILAVTVWVVATNAANPSRRAFYPDALPIEFTNGADNLVVYHQSEDSVRVELRAPQASWDQLRPGSFHVSADLRSLEPGVHTVNVDVRVDDPRRAGKMPRHSGAQQAVSMRFRKAECRKALRFGQRRRRMSPETYVFLLLFISYLIDTISNQGTLACESLNNDQQIVIFQSTTRKYPKMKTSIMKITGALIVAAIP